jgi:glycosyltransferase involved in cell wall biosynthesis
LERISVVVDARILSKPMTGVQMHVLELLGALARTEKVRLSALVPTQPTSDATEALRALPDVALIDYEEASRKAERAAIVHRPYQLSDPGDIAFLASLGDRLVVTQHDLIGYHNPAYFPSAEAWQGYRELTRAALGTADRVVFGSRYALDQALAEELVEPSRASVVPSGTDQRTRRSDVQPAGPPATAALDPDANLLLCLGNDYRHKNRLFALRVLEQLQVGGWSGYLVLAGPTVAHGSSKDDEARWLESHPAIAPFILDVGAVSEAEKTWLLERTALVLYPSVYEGFGVIPFEAAEHGVPCMWSAVTSLAEVLPETAATISAWNVQESAAHALELLRSDEARKQNVEAIRAAGAAFTWEATAAQLLELYGATCDVPPTLASRLSRRGGSLAGTVSEDAMRLLGPGGALPRDLERPLLAIANRPGLAAPLFAALRAGYRASYTLRRWGTFNGRRSRTARGQSLK